MNKCKKCIYYEELEYGDKVLWNFCCKGHKMQEKCPNFKSKKLIITLCGVLLGLVIGYITVKSRS